MGTNRPPRTVGPFFLPEQKQPEHCPGCFTLFMLVPAASILMLTASAASIGLLFIAVLTGIDPVPELPHGHAGGLLRRNARIKGMQLLIGVVLAQGQPQGLASARSSELPA